MKHALVAIHAGLGEIGAFASLWVFVELLNPTDRRIRRAQTAALIAVVFLCLSWIAGGYYYVVDYGPEVKPRINEGPSAYAHGIFMESKEHIFIFLPILAAYLFGLLRQCGASLIDDPALRRSTLALTGTIFLLAMSMAGTGYVISMGFRMALEQTVGIGP